MITAGRAQQFRATLGGAYAVPPPPPCVSHSAPVSIAGETYWLHNGGIIAFGEETYQATLGGVVQTGSYIWVPTGFTETIFLMPDDGSANSTLHFLITDLFGCDARGGTYIIEETGQSGAYTVTRPGSHICPLPLEEQVEALLARLNAAEMNAEMPARFLRGLRHSLLRAGAAFEKDKLRSGIHHLRQFQQQVRARVRAGLWRWHPHVADHLISRAQQIIDRATQQLPPRGHHDDDDEEDED
jgi:hypothetical protein